jgi:GNAT superfamily N-acetyltransferase
MDVEPLKEADLTGAARVHQLAFTRQRKSREWLAAKLRAYPATYSYTAKIGAEIVGGILWTHKSGFREQAVIELEQIFVLPERQHKGIGAALILRSLADVNAQIEKEGFRIGTLCVNTRSDNNALKLYESTLSVRKICEIEGHTPGATEVFLAATDVDVKKLLAARC